MQTSPRAFILRFPSAGQTSPLSSSCYWRCFGYLACSSFFRLTSLLSALALAFVCLTKGEVAIAAAEAEAEAEAASKTATCRRFLAQCAIRISIFLNYWPILLGASLAHIYVHMRLFIITDGLGKSKTKLQSQLLDAVKMSLWFSKGVLLTLNWSRRLKICNLSSWLGDNFPQNSRNGEMHIDMDFHFNLQFDCLSEIDVFEKTARGARP